MKASQVLRVLILLLLLLLPLRQMVLVFSRQRDPRAPSSAMNSVFDDH